MSYSVYNKVICSENFLKNYLIDPYPLGKDEKVSSEYLSFNRICGAKDIDEYSDKYGAYMYYGRGHSYKRLEDGNFEVLFATYDWYPICAIVKAIEIDHNVIWYAVGEEIIYMSKFSWDGKKVIEMTYDLESDDYCEWEDANWDQLKDLDDCDCIAWHYDTEKYDMWVCWDSDDLIERYKYDNPTKDYYEWRSDIERTIHKLDIEHNLRIYIGSNITIERIDGDHWYGKLISVEYDPENIEFYALMFYDGAARRIYESEIETIIPNYFDRNDSIINSVRTILAGKYLLWDGGIITGKTGTFPVVNIVNEGETIRVDYCRDLSAEDVVSFEVFEKPEVDAIVSSIERKFAQEQPKKKRFGFWHRKK